MHSTTFAWGKAVESLSETTGTTCQTYSPFVAQPAIAHSQGGGNMVFFRVLSIFFPLRSTHLKIRRSYLLMSQFIHLSTPPITMNEKKGLKN